MATRKKDLPFREIWCVISAIFLLMITLLTVDFMYWSVHFMSSF